MARYELVGAVFVVAFSALLVALLVRHLRERWGGRGASPIAARALLARFRYGPDQWRRFRWLALVPILRTSAILFAVFVLLSSAGALVFGLLLDEPLSRLARAEGRWVAAVIAGTGAAFSLLCALYMSVRTHVLRWAFTPSPRAEVLVYSTGIVIAGVGIPWADPDHALVGVLLTPDRDLLVLHRENREQEEEGGRYVWLSSTLRLPVPPGLDVERVISGVEISPGHGSKPPAEG